MSFKYSENMAHNIDGSFASIPTFPQMRCDHRVIIYVLLILPLYTIPGCPRGSHRPTDLLLDRQSGAALEAAIGTRRSSFFHRSASVIGGLNAMPSIARQM